jgi:hypothetical protein
MQPESPIAALSRLAEASLGVFRGTAAIQIGISRNQLSRLHSSNVIERVLPDTCRLTAVGRSSEQRLRAALLWAGGRRGRGRSIGR